MVRSARRAASSALETGRLQALAQRRQPALEAGLHRGADRLAARRHLERGGGDGAAALEVRRLEAGGEQAGERLDGVGHRRLGPQQVHDRRRHLAACACDRLGADLLLAAREVVVERPARGLAALQQLVQPGAVIALALEQVDGGIQKALAARTRHRSLSRPIFIVPRQGHVATAVTRPRSRRAPAPPPSTAGTSCSATRSERRTTAATTIAAITRPAPMAKARW